MALPTPVTTSDMSRESRSMSTPNGMEKSGSPIHVTDSSTGGASPPLRAWTNSDSAQANESSSPPLASSALNRRREIPKRRIPSAETSGLSNRVHAQKTAEG